MILYLKEVETACQKFQITEERRNFLRDNIFRTELPIYGLSVVQIRVLLKEGFSFSDKSVNEQKKIWHHLYKTAQSFEVLSMALIFFQGLKKELTLADWKLLKTWSSKIENWEHSDRLSDLYSELHERYPRDIFPTLKKWNSSKNPWLRRLSIVSLFYYANSRKKQPAFSKTLNLVKNLLYDDHIYVQKAVGWTLRELYNVYPDKTYVYLTELAADLPPASWQAATEKLTKQQKRTLTSIRKKK